MEVNLEPDHDGSDWCTAVHLLLLVGIPELICIGGWLSWASVDGVGEIPT